jgi:hypothetical protein
VSLLHESQESSTPDGHVDTPSSPLPLPPALLPPHHSFCHGQPPPSASLSCRRLSCLPLHPPREHFDLSFNSISHVKGWLQTCCHLDWSEELSSSRSGHTTDTQQTHNRHTTDTKRTQCDSSYTFVQHDSRCCLSPGGPDNNRQVLPSELPS